MEKKLLDANSFSVLLETTMKKKGLSHIDAIIQICEAKNLDIEAVPDLLTPKLRKRIQNEALDLNMMKRKRRK